MIKLIQELDVALELKDPVLLAFDAFNVTISLPESERIENINTLSNFYGSDSSSKFQDVNIAMPLIPSPQIAPPAIIQFFQDFD